MATLFELTDINNALISLGGALERNDHFIKLTNTRTNSLVYEIPNAVLSFTNPLSRFIRVDGRNNSITAQVMEMMMVLSGNPELRYLSYFLPRAKNYSDDGVIWRGNYGTRIRGSRTFPAFNDHGALRNIKKDGLISVANLLTKDPTSRQAFITIGDNKIDSDIVTLDTPCTMTLVYRIIDNKLNATTFMRSNDIIFGFSGVNYFIFTCLQELLASHLGIEVGSYTHYAVSFHVYDNYRDNLIKIGKSDNVNPIDVELFGQMKIQEFDLLARRYFMEFNNFIETTDYERVIKFYDDNKDLGRVVDLLMTTFSRASKYLLGLDRFESIMNNIIDKNDVISEVITRDKFISSKLSGIDR